MKLNQEKTTPFLGLEACHPRPPLSRRVNSGGDPDTPKLFSWEDSKVVILPLPYEKTVSYGKGTANGPSALLKASSQVELFDEELESEPYKCGIYTASALDFGEKEGASAIALIEEATAEIVNAGKFPLGLGGEHTVSTGLVKAVHKKYPDLHVVHLDAHADMRPEYDGTPWSHASVMHRISELGIPYTSIGIRALCSEEYELIKAGGPRCHSGASQGLVRLWRKSRNPDIHVSNLKNYFFAHQIAKNSNWIKDALKTIEGPVYLTLDIDVFDGSMIPHTGTPVPGGLNWYQVTDFVRALMEKHNVVGADLVELASDESSRVSDFAAAKLVYKLIGYKSLSS